MDAMIEELLAENASDIKAINDILMAWDRSDVFLEGGNFVQNTIDFIQKILNQIKNLLKKFFAAVDDGIRYLFLSKKNKEEYNAYVAYVQAHPETKNKTITVKDWRKASVQYLAAEKRIREMMANPGISADQMNTEAQGIFQSLNEVAKAGTAVLTVDFVMQFAKQSPEAAQEIRKALAGCQAAVANIEQQLGQREVVKLQKNLDRLSKESAGQKLLAMLYGRKEKDLATCFNDAMGSMKDLLGAATNGSTGDKIKAVANHGHLVRTTAKAYARNKNLRQSVKQGAQAVKDINNPNTQVGALVDTAKAFIAPKVQ